METAAAILVQILFDDDSTLKAKMTAQAAISPEAAAAFLKPYWIEMMKVLKRAQAENPGIR